jgi:diguanylate cyclase (GGDEF)-like protein
MRDTVTGLPSRNALLAALRERIVLGQGAIVLVDLDGFKESCQGLSRDQIDRLLAEVARRLEARTEGNSLLFRYARSVFCLLLPEADRDAAARAAETLRSAVAGEPFAVPGASEKHASRSLALTVTAAAAAFPQDGRSPTALVETAELAVLASQHAGPNRVAVAGRLDPAVLAQIGVFRGLPCPVMVGRVGEQSRLRQAALDVRHVGPSFALVTGPAGIGKTRLVRELCRWARAERFVTLSGTCQEARATLPYAVAAELVENLLVTDPGPALEALERLGPAHRAALCVVVRDFPPQMTLGKIEISEYGRMIFDAFGALLDELARTGPLLVSLDEAEHADGATFEVLQAAMDRRIPFLAVAATNQDPAAFQQTPAGDFYRSRAANPLHLQIPPLSLEEVEKLLHAILPDADIAREIAHRLVERAAGNPLYLEETVRSLLLRGRAKLVDGRWSVPALDPQDLPETLDAAIRSVAEALPARANSLLTRAAVLGNQIDSDLLQEVVGQDEMEMLDLIDEARRSRLLVASEAGGDRLLFPAEHARRIRLAATPAAERREIHGRVGVVQEARHGGDVAHLADELAFHYSRSGNEERARHFDAIARKRAALIQPPRLEGVRRARVDPVKEPLSPEALNHALAVMRHFHGALKIGRLYPQWNQVSTTFVTQLREELGKLLEITPGLTIHNSPTGPQLNGQPCTHSAAAEFCALLDDHLVESITILRSFNLSGLDSVIRAFMEPLDRGRTEPDLWDRFLTREGLEAIDLVQKAFQARDTIRTRIEASAEAPVPPDELPAVRDALRSLKAAVENLRLYPPGHALVEETAQEAVRVMLALLGRVPALTLGTAEGELVLNGRPVDRKFFQDAGGFILREIDRRELGSVTLTRGLTKDEARALVSFLAMAPEDQAAAAQRLEGQFVHVTFGSRRYERATEGAEIVELTPPPKPIRSEIRAREHLARSYADFLSAELQEQFPNLVEVLAYGTRRPLAEEMVSRLGSHFHDPDVAHRRTAYKLLVRSLAFASPSARQVEVMQSSPPLRRRLIEDFDIMAFKAAAELLSLWIPAAATAGCLRELAEIAGPVLRRRASSSETPQAIAVACDRALHIIPDTGAYAVLLAAAERPRLEERMAAVSILLAIGGRAVERLVEVLVDEPDRTIRGNIALAIGLAADAVAGPLVRALTPETPPDRLARVLEVAAPLLTSSVLAHFAGLAEKGGPEVRREVLRAIEQWPAPAGVAILRRLIASPAEANRDAAIETAARLKIDQVSADVGRLLEGAQDEGLIRTCCRYFAAVPNPTAVPLLSRIAARRPRFFGLVKGYSQETRAEAARALEPAAPAGAKT